MAKAIKKQVLGRGLSALLRDTKDDIVSVKDENADKLVGNILEIELEAIAVNPFQPRTNFNEEALRELASSIKELGVIQPITVRKLEGNTFQLVSGERRFRASKLIGLKSIPAYVRLANDQEMLEMLNTADVTVNPDVANKMNNKSTNQQKYKKSFFQRITEFFDKLIGIKPEDYGTDEESGYINEHFNDFPRIKRR